MIVEGKRRDTRSWDSESVAGGGYTSHILELAGLGQITQLLRTVSDSTPTESYPLSSC